MKFVRRPDLNTKTRIDIALAAYLSQGIYGTITSLAQAYRVSRLFVYQLLWILSIALKEEFEIPTAKPRVQNLPPLDKAVLLRVPHGCWKVNVLSRVFPLFCRTSAIPITLPAISAKDSPFMLPG